MLDTLASREEDNPGIPEQVTFGDLSEEELLSFGTDDDAAAAVEVSDQRHGISAQQRIRTGSSARSGSQAAASADASGDDAMQSPNETPDDSTSKSTGSGNDSGAEQAGSSSDSGSSLAKAVAADQAAAAALEDAEQLKRATARRLSEAQRQAAQQGHVHSLLRARQALQQVSDAPTVTQLHQLWDSVDAQLRRGLLDSYADDALRPHLSQQDLQLARLLKQYYMLLCDKADAEVLHTNPDGSRRFLGRLGPINRSNCLSDHDMTVEVTADETEAVITAYQDCVDRDESIPPDVARAFADEVASGRYAAFLQKYKSVLRKLGKLRKGWRPYHDPEGRADQLGHGDFRGKGKWVKKDKKRPYQGGDGKARKPGSDGAGTSRDAAKTAQEERQRRFHADECFHCGKPGHKKFECPELHKKK